MFWIWSCAKWCPKTVKYLRFWNLSNLNIQSRESKLLNEKDPMWRWNLFHNVGFSPTAFIILHTCKAFFRSLCGSFFRIFWMISFGKSNILKDSSSISSSEQGRTIVYFLQVELTLRKTYILFSSRQNISCSVHK